MTAQAGPERRQHPRKVVHIAAHLIDEERGGPGRTVAVHDLSLKGMAIRADGLALKPGDRLRLCLAADKLNCGSEHLIEATVMNLRDDFAGLQFDSVGILVLQDLQQLLRNERTF